MSLWACGVCTYENDGARTLCEVCQSERPAAAASAPPRAQPQAPAMPRAAPAATTAGGLPVMEEADPALVGRLVAMGFPAAAAARALEERGNDQQRALDWLIENQVTASPAKPKPKPKPKLKPEPEPAKRRATERKEDPDAARRKREREELEREVREQEERRKQEAKEAARRERELIKEAARAARARKEKEEKERLMKRAAAERERDERAALEAERRRRRHEEQEASLRTVDEALAHVGENYTVARLQDMCAMLARIVGNVLAHPGEEKYRTVRTSSERFQHAVGRPVGGVRVLKLLGFEEDAAAGALVLRGKPDERRLRDGLDRVRAALRATSAGVHEALEEAARQGADDEAVYFAAEALLAVARNALVAHGSTSRDFRSVDTSGELFRGRLAPAEPVVRLMREGLGFRPEREDRFLVVAEPDPRAFGAAARECVTALARLRPATPVARAVAALLRNNADAQAVARFVDKVAVCLRRVHDTPGEVKYHRLKLKGLFRLAGGGNLLGGAELFERFGFAHDAIANTVTLPFPSGYDHDLFGRRLKLLGEVWAAHLAQLQGGAA